MSQAPFGRRHARVHAREEIGSYVLLEVDDAGGPVPAAGQFYMLMASEWGGQGDERPFLPRAFSVARAARPSRVELTTTTVADSTLDVLGGRLTFLLEDIGPGTHVLAGLWAGDDIDLTGPLGSGFTPAGERAILVGGGIGTAPLLIWQDELVRAQTPHVTILGFRDAPHAEVARLFTNARVATDDGSLGHHGFVTDLLREELDAGVGGSPSIHACGPPGMLEAVREIAVARGVPAQLALESAMACGFGACFGCVVPLRDGGYARVCVDGPVMDADALREVPAH